MCHKCQRPKGDKDKVDIALDIALTIFAFIMLFAIFAKIAMLIVE